MLALSLAAAALFMTAAITDIRSRRIPNALPVGLALLGLVRVTAALVTDTAILAALADLGTAFALFALGALAFRQGMLGGGDVKLMAAGGLWLGAASIGAYALLTAMAGGLLALVYLALRLAVPVTGNSDRPQGLPYGVAIATGGILATFAPLWMT